MNGDADMIASSQPPMQDGPMHEEEADSAFPLEAWTEALTTIAHHYRLPVSAQNARLAASWHGDANEAQRIRALARGAGLHVHLAEPGSVPVDAERLPMILVLQSGALAVVSAIAEDGQVRATITGEGGLANAMALDDLLSHARLLVLARPARSAPDARVDTYIRPYEDHWLRRTVFRDVGAYGHVAVASLITSLLGLATVVFSMQVYDRVVPAESYSTLYVLFIGVVIAIGFDFLLRRLRMRIIDVLGKEADMRVSDQVLGHALRVRNSDRPASTGTFIAQLRDLDQVRELMTSTTVSALVDLPFFLLFVIILWFIAGWLALVPLGILFLMILPGILAQRRLRACANDAMRESSLRNAMLVEAVQRLGDIKTLQAENRFQQQWNRHNAVAGEAQLRMRGLTNSLTVWSHNMQNLSYAGVVFFGAPMVMAGELTTGALVAASILSSRMIAPMAQLTQVLSRLQQARLATSSIDQIMALPVDTPNDQQRIPAPAIRGHFALKFAVFHYGAEEGPPALNVANLEIRPGEKVALLGRNGAGKSTLLQGLSGLLAPRTGEVLLDDMALSQIDPADVRRDVGLLTQGSRLFHGTLRENLTMGAPQASTQEIIEALRMTGAQEFVRRLGAGLEHVVQEGGEGLSGGQLQSLLLARLIIREPSVLLLDEPTAAMDDATERLFIEKMQRWGRARTLVIATHRMRVLDIVDRIIVIHDGQVTLDDTRDAALQRMQATGVRPEPVRGKLI